MSPTTPPATGDAAPDFEALLCNGETFRPVSLSRLLDGERGCVLVFFGFPGVRSPRTGGSATTGPAGTASAFP